MHRLLQTPACLQTLAKQVESRLSVGELHAPAGERTTLVGGEKLVFPYRVYYTPDRIAEAARDSQGEALALTLCLASRHWDGHVREAAIRNLDLFGRPWVIPFAVQLLGEYVVQVGKAVEERITELGVQPFLNFARENTDFIETTRRRATSYWDCYYRNEYKTLEDFPCYRAIHAIRSAL